MINLYKNKPTTPMLLSVLALALFCIFPQYPVRAQSSGGGFSSGCYSGDGTFLRKIKVPWQPAFVIIKGNEDGTFFAYESQEGFPSTGMALEPDGFTVFNTRDTNQFGKSYCWYAFQAGSNLAVGTYTGNGSSTQDITGIGFQPDLVLLTAAGNNIVARSASYKSYIATWVFDNRWPATSTINALLPDGFRVSDPNDDATDGNVNGAVYYYVAFKDGANFFREGIYTGDGTQNRDVTLSNCSPKFVYVSRPGGYMAPATIRSDALQGDQSQIIFWFGDTSNHSNFIQSLGTNKFTVGSDAAVNGPGVTYAYFAMCTETRP